MMVAPLDKQNPKNIQDSKLRNSSNSTRPPLLPSEKDNDNKSTSRPKSKQVLSRYMSPSPSSSTRRSPSPTVSRTPSRAVSVDRRRPLPSRPDLNAKLSKNCTEMSKNGTEMSNSVKNGIGMSNSVKKVGEMSNAAKMLVMSTRSLSVSFQGEAYSCPVSKTKAVERPSLGSVRKGTPEKRNSSCSVQNGSEMSDSVNNGTEMSNAAKMLVTSTRSFSVSFQGEAYSLPVSKTKATERPSVASVRKGTPERRNSNSSSSSTNVDQHRWPARIRQWNTLSRSSDYSVDDSKKLVESEKVIVQDKMVDDGRRQSVDGRLGLGLGNSELLKARELGPDWNSDSESVSSGSTSGMQDCGGVKQRGVTVSSKFWQETNSRLRRLQDPGSGLPLSTSPAKLVVPPKFGQPKRYPNDGVMSSSRPMSSPRPMSPRTISSPVRRPSSPSKVFSSVVSSPSRVMTSPSRVRSSLLSETPSVLSYAVDVRRGKVGENQLVDAHLLRLLYNRHLQWRFVNARTEAALLVQKRSAEKKLWNAWITISDLRDSVTKKRNRLQLIRQKLKLASILRGQITFLEDWASFQKDHFVSLVGAIEALRASTLRLPIVGATADVQNVKEAIGSAVDKMETMASSLCLLSSKAEEMNSLMGELAKMTTKESALLEQCKGFFSMLASMQVKNCSLRTHVLQHHRIPAA